MALGGGVFKGLSAGSIIAGMILLAVAFRAAASAIPEVQHGGNNIAALNIPFNTMFSGSSGIVILAVMGALILAVLGVLGLSSKR